MCLSKKTLAKVILGSLFALPLSAGSPSGNPESAEPFVINYVREGISQYGSGYQSDFALKIKSFMWDNRHAIDTLQVTEERTIEAFFCILKTKFDAEVPTEFSDFPPWQDYCNRLAARPTN